MDSNPTQGSKNEKALLGIHCTSYVCPAQVSHLGMLRSLFCAIRMGAGAYVLAAVRSSQGAVICSTIFFIELSRKLQISGSLFTWFTCFEIHLHYQD